MNSKPKLLIAEDNVALAGILRFNLERAGYDVTVAKNGQIAADHASREEFDLIVSDQQMPRMTGVELCRFVRSSPVNSNVPFMLLTAKAFEIDRQALAAEYDIQDVIEKPFSPSGIVDVVGQMLAPLER